jgi:hypothetical protein
LKPAKVNAMNTYLYGIGLMICVSNDYVRLPAAGNVRQGHVWVGHRGVLGRILDSYPRTIAGVWIPPMHWSAEYRLGVLRW